LRQWQVDPPYHDLLLLLLPATGNDISFWSYNQLFELMLLFGRCSNLSTMEINNFINLWESQESSLFYSSTLIHKFTFSRIQTTPSPDYL
jgi:hypothetical protein